MKNRCTNENATNYAIYGGRGITVCRRWLDFEKFWLDMGPTWAKDMSLDRIDPNGNYEPGNVRWATDAQQGLNRRNHVMIATPDGQLPLAEAARRSGVGYQTISARMRYGWKPEELLLPVTKDNSRRQDNVIIPTPNGPMNASDAARRFGFRPATIFTRLRLGWPAEDLLKPIAKVRNRNSKGVFT